MFRHYLMIAAKVLQHAPGTALINVFTLALGLVSFVAAYAVVGYWQGSEAYFDNADRTYVITANMALRDGSIATGTIPQTNQLYERYLKVEFPEFEAIARANPWSQEATISVNGQGARVVAVAVDPEFLTIFNLPFVAGDSETALTNPGSILLSETAARRLFGRTDVLGETVTLGGNLVDGVVTGVIGSIPEPSHIGNDTIAPMNFDIIAPYKLYERLSRAVGNQPTLEEGKEEAPAEDPSSDDWFSGYCCTTYAMLKKDSGVTRADLNRRLAGFVERRLNPEMLAMASLTVGAVPVSGLLVTTLNSELLGSASGTLSITTLLFALGTLVLVIACINYANLAAARAMRRAREIGLRKTLGAQRRQIFMQHLFEAGLLSLAALAIAVLVLYLIAPWVSQATGIDLRLGLFSGTGFWLAMTLLLAGVTLLGGSYPGLVLARISPIEALRQGRMRLGPRLVAAMLVGLQFAAASLLVITVIVMFNQNTALRKTGLGATSDPYLVINNFERVTGVNNERLREELLRNPQVTGITEMGSPPWSDNVNLNLLTRTPEAGAETHTAFWNNVGYDFFETFDIPVIAGRVFDRAHNDLPPQGEDADPTTPRNLVIDRAFAEQLGFASPAEAIDQLLYQPSQFGPSPPRRVIGVVENRPLYLRGFGATANGYGLSTNMINQVVRLSAADVSGGMAAIEDTWRRLNARSPLQSQFVDQSFEESYRNFARINQAFTGVAVFAIAIAVIGLFGMAVQTAGRRRHEIGVRKSLGATKRQIVLMLLRDFSKPVIIANLLAWPLAWFAARLYLNTFIQRIDLTALPFFLSMAFVLVVAWIAVGSQAWRAAGAETADILRFE